MDTKIAENLKKLREKHSLTQEALAMALGVPELIIYKWEAARLPVDYKVLLKIAEFYNVPVDSILGGEADDYRKNSKSDKVSFTCKVCGGTLVYDYAAATCKCANCGNKWAVAELYPKYAHVIATVNKASRVLNGKTVLASADEAKLLFSQAIVECNKFNDVLSAEIIKICDEGLKEAEKLEVYCRGKYFFDNKAYKSALNELAKVPGYRDADELVKRCRR